MGQASLSAAIIGTREPDQAQYWAARRLSFMLSRYFDCRIRTGAAFGIDEQSMVGAHPGMLDVFLPWASYNKDIIPAHARITVADRHKHARWFDSVWEAHPAPGRLTRGAFALHARNYGIIEDAALVVAFPNERGGGGTGQGIRLAQALDKPLLSFNKGSEIPALELLVDQCMYALRNKLQDAA